MVSVDDAFELIAKATPGSPVERVPVERATGRVSAATVESPIDLPPFAQSAMDGYVVRAEDVEGATPEEPVELQIVGEVAAGDAEKPPALGPGEALRIFTGGRVPEGGDTIVRQERARRDGDRLYLERTFPEGADLRPVGEELERGVALVEAGQRLDERHVAALAMTGHGDVRLHRQPRIALLVSGDEIVGPGVELGPGEIYDANTPFLGGLLQRIGYDSVEIHHLADESGGVERALDEALEAFDLVVSTGGVSVGDYDFFGQAAAALGVEEIFWGVDQKPGRPVYFGVRDGTPFLGLPGNPGAVYVDAHLYLMRVLDVLEGVAPPGPRLREGRLSAEIRRSSKRLRWSPCRVSISEEGIVVLEPIDGGRAHRMGQLFRADALVRVGAGDGAVDEGSLVEWLPTA